MYVYDFSGGKLFRMWRVHMLVLSVFLFFAMHDTRTAFFLVSSLFVACRTIHFPFAFKSSSSVDAYESILSFSSPAVRTSNLKTKGPRLVFPKKKMHKTVTRTHRHTPRRRHDEQVLAYLAPLPAMHIVPTRLHT